ncbi:hypothetical protein OIU76_018697 [Salix suchowensis]|nr:hypothetical protein OIU76_018697 [Salix suchowensis]
MKHRFLHSAQNPRTGELVGKTAGIQLKRLPQSSHSSAMNKHINNLL